jgi:hypothetical protein
VARSENGQLTLVTAFRREGHEAREDREGNGGDFRERRAAAPLARIETQEIEDQNAQLNSEAL